MAKKRQPKAKELAALKAGKQSALDAVKRRKAAAITRAAAVAKAKGTTVTHGAGAMMLGAAHGATATSVGTLVAEGDSWFDYPFFDVLKLLEDKHGYDVESVAHKGDTIEGMAYGGAKKDGTLGGQLDDFSRRIEKVVRNGITPRAILLSGGGNDVAGDEFAVLLNHSESPTRGLNERVVEGIIEDRIRFAYIKILSEITTLCEAQTGKTIPILLHGYDYPVPDGRGFLGGWWVLPGPWLKPGFDAKGYYNLAENIAILKDLIDRMCVMLKSVTALPQFAHVEFIDLRGSLSNSVADYKKWWGNELHPTEQGFAVVANMFAASIP